MFRQSIRLFGSVPITSRRVSSEPKVLSSFLFWLAQNGTDFRNVDVKSIDSSETGWGVFTTKPCKKGDTLVKLPLRMTLSIPPVDHAQHNPKLRELVDQLPIEMWHFALGLRLLSERTRPYDKATSWWPYIGALPLFVSGIPLFFSQQQQKDLQYRPFEVHLRRRALTLAKLSSVVSKDYPDLFHGHKLDVHSLGWSVSATSSRAFSFGHTIEHKRLLPLIDMSNHSFDYNCKVSFRSGSTSSEDLVLLECIKDIDVGQEVLINYGHVSNDELLMAYGFVVDNNPYDECQVSYEPDMLEAVADLSGDSLPHSASLEALPPAKRELLTHFRYAIAPPPSSAPSTPAITSSTSSSTSSSKPASFSIRPVKSGGIDPKLLAALRILYADEDTVSRLSVSASTVSASSAAPRIGLHSAPMSRWEEPTIAGNIVEKKVMNCVKTLMAMLSSSFPSTLDDDIEALPKQQTHHHRLVYQFRIGKKKILQENMQHAHDLLQIL